MEFLSQFQFDLLCEKGNTNMADPLSRRPDYAPILSAIVTRSRVAANSYLPVPLYPSPACAADVGRVRR